MLNDLQLADPSVLPEFPYRDDGMLVYSAIKKYVTDIINIYYGGSLNNYMNDQLNSCHTCLYLYILLLVEQPNSHEKLLLFSHFIAVGIQLCDDTA